MEQTSFDEEREIVNLCNLLANNSFKEIWDKEDDNYWNSYLGLSSINNDEINEKIVFIILWFMRKHLSNVVGIQLTYQKHNSENHLLEILPKELFESENVINFRFELSQEFTKLFPNENLVFITDDSLNKIDKNKVSLTIVE